MYMHVQDINEYMEFISMKAIMAPFSDLFLYFFPNSSSEASQLWKFGQVTSAF